jgi:hypothetical protein
MHQLVDPQKGPRLRRLPLFHFGNHPTMPGSSNRRGLKVSCDATLPQAVDFRGTRCWRHLLKTAAKVVVMQRCHQQDLSGHLLEQGDWEHLCLPAEYESSRPATSIGLPIHVENTGNFYGLSASVPRRSNR